MVEDDGVPPTRASLRLKDLDKFWVPMQLEMEKDSECDKEWVVCCGYDAMLLRGSEYCSPIASLHLFGVAKLNTKCIAKVQHLL